jgi:hypothetical protein
MELSMCECGKMDVERERERDWENHRLPHRQRSMDLLNSCLYEYLILNATLNDTFQGILHDHYGLSADTFWGTQFSPQHQSRENENFGVLFVKGYMGIGEECVPSDWSHKTLNRETHCAYCQSEHVRKNVKVQREIHPRGSWDIEAERKPLNWTGRPGLFLLHLLLGWE